MRGFFVDGVRSRSIGRSRPPDPVLASRRTADGCWSIHCLDPGAIVSIRSFRPARLPARAVLPTFLAAVMAGCAHGGDPVPTTASEDVAPAAVPATRDVLEVDIATLSARMQRGEV